MICKKTQKYFSVHIHFKFEFIMSLITCEWLLQFIVLLTTYLQSVDLDLHQTHAQANVVIRSLRNERKKGPWNKLYQAAVSISEKHGIVISKPRLDGRNASRKCSV